MAKAIYIRKHVLGLTVPEGFLESMIIMAASLTAGRHGSGPVAESLLQIHKCEIGNDRVNWK